MQAVRGAARPLVREVVAVTYVVTVLGLFITSATATVPVTLTGIQQAWIDTFFFVFAMASGYIVFGKKAIDDAIDTWQTLKGAGD